MTLSPRRPRRVWLWLGIAGSVALVVAVVAATLGYVLGSSDGQTPKRGDLLVTMSVVTTTGGPPPAATLERAKQVLLSRLRGAHLDRPAVTVVGPTKVTVSAGGVTPDQLRMLITLGQLAFRKVLATTPDQPGNGAPAGCVPAQRNSHGPTAELAQARDVLGTAYALAEAIQDPSKVDAQMLPLLAPFAKLTCPELDALPVRMKFNVPTVPCSQLAFLRTFKAGEPDVATDQLVTCGQGSEEHTKFLLDVAKVQGADLSSAKASYDAVNNNGWNVQLHFTGSGQSKWTALSEEAMQSVAQTGSGAQVAIVVDGAIQSAPQIQGVITGDAVISGGMDANSTKTLAALLGYGELPVRFVVDAMTAVR